MPDTQTNPPLRLLAAFQSSFPDAVSQVLFQAPGREMWIAASVALSDVYTLVLPDLDSRVAFNWRTARSKRTVTNRPLPSWARYPAGVVLALSADGINVPGVDAVIVGEEPLGPRYDHALGIAVAALWHEFHQRPYSTQALLDIVERVRREYLDR